MGGGGWFGGVQVWGGGVRVDVIEVFGKFTQKNSAGGVGGVGSGGFRFGEGGQGGCK